DRPSDIYSELARRVSEALQDDDSWQAYRLRDHVHRSTVKQPVMTNVYGVTQVGARRMLQNQLLEQGVEKDRAYDLAKYLTVVVMRELEGVCPAAHRAMKWLSECADLIAKADHDVRWTSPLGLPVVQP